MAVRLSRKAKKLRRYGNSSPFVPLLQRSLIRPKEETNDREKTEKSAKEETETKRKKEKGTSALGSGMLPSQEQEKLAARINISRTTNN